MRQEIPPAERLLWERLRGRYLAELKFRCQHPIGPLIVDFYSAVYHLVVEVDSPIHLHQLEPIRQRSWILEAQGYRILRLPNDQVENDLESPWKVSWPPARDVDSLLLSKGSFLWQS